MNTETNNNDNVSNININTLQSLIMSKCPEIKLTDKIGKSDVWKNYNQIVYKEITYKDKVLCKYCQKIFQFTGKNGTSHLLRHSATCLKSPNKIINQPTVSFFAKRKINSEDKKHINRIAVKFIAEDMRPLNVIEGKGFQVSIKITIIEIVIYLYFRRTFL